MKLAYWLGSLRRPLSSASTERSDPPDTAISDGVDYSLPVVVPGWMQRTFSGQQLREFVENATRAPYRNQFDTPYKKDLPVDPVTEDPLKEWSWSTRVRVLTNCHAAYERNPMANAAVQYSADFIIGDGFNLNCKNTEVSDVLYAFIDDQLNAIREYERQAAIDLQVDGELLLRKFKGNAEDGTQSQIRVVPLRPWECEYIRTKPGDFRTREAYHFQFDKNYGDDPLQAGSTEQIDVVADDIIHVAINRHAYELRGRPDLFRILPWLRAYTEYLENRARQNVWRNALVWWAKVVQGTADTISQVSAAFAKPPAPGTVVTTSDRVELTPLSGGGGAGDMEDGRAIKNMAITGMRMAEYMFADGENANLATATAQQLPALTRFEGYQRVLIEQLWYPLFKNVLQTAIDAGFLPEEVEEQDEDGEAIKEEPPVDEAPKMKPVIPGSQDGATPGMQMPVPNVPEGKAKSIKTLEAFEVTYEPVNDTDPKTLADALTIAVTNEWISNQTAAKELGYDYHYEQKLIKRERQTQQKEMAAGQRPIPPDMMRPEAMPMGKPGANGQQPQGQQKQGAVEK
jgi:hypothetical protein